MKCDTRPCRAENANWRVKIKQKIKRVGVRPWGLHHAFTRERESEKERERVRGERERERDGERERVREGKKERERERERNLF